jgi:hypothetical protein
MPAKKRPRRAQQVRKNNDRQKKNAAKTMDSIALGWMVTYSTHNLWRMPSIYGLDDLIQEGHWCWQYVIHQYPRAKTAAHLMSLFKLTVHSHFTNLSNRKRKEDTILSYFQIEPNDLLLEESTLCYLLRNAPPDIKGVLLMFARHKHLRQTTHRRKRNGTRETSSEMLCRLAGLPETPDLVGRIRDYFSPH